MLLTFLPVPLLMLEVTDEPRTEQLALLLAVPTVASWLVPAGKADTGNLSGQTPTTKMAWAMAWEDVDGPSEMQP